MDATGIGGGITARLSMVAALAALGHDVVAYVDCAAPVDHAGVRYRPLDALTHIECDVLVAIATGAATSLALPPGIPVNARLRIAWFQGLKPHLIEIEPLAPDYIYVPSNFLRDVCVERWGLPPERVFVTYNGIQQERFEAAAADERTPPRDPFALVYIGPKAKGLDAAIQVQRRLYAEDRRYHLDVVGGNRLWSQPDPPLPNAPSVRLIGMLGQAELVPRLFQYEYCLAPQAMEEGFGIAVQEAKRAGVIVLASDVGAFGELICTGQDGFLVPEPHASPASDDHFVRVILRLASDPVERARLRATAMRTPWSWTLAARTWVAHWDQVLTPRLSAAESTPSAESCLELPDGRHSTTGYYEPSVYPLSPMHNRLGAEDHDAAGRNIAAAIDRLHWRQPADSPVTPEWAGLLRTTLLERIRYAEMMEARADGLRARVRALEDALARRPAEAREMSRPDASADAERTELHRQLDARTEELVLLGTQLGEARSDLAARPGDWRRRSRRSARHAVRTAQARTVQAARPMFRVTSALLRKSVPAPVRAVVGRVISRRLMSPRTYAFDRFIEARMATYGTDFGPLRAVGEPGLVSIVLPAYNGAALIRECIDSVLSQTYPQLELIVVDDGSTDETAAIVYAYARQDPRVRVVHQANARLPRALSRGFRLARGEFLTWTSCDNRLRPAFVESMVACLTRHPTWDMTYANFDIIGDDGLPLLDTKYWDPYQQPHGSGHIHLPPTTAELNVRAYNSIGAAFLYRSRVAHLIGDYSRFRFLLEDYDYWMRINALMTVRHADFDEAHYDYRLHGQSLTAQWDPFDMTRQRDRLMVFDDYRRNFLLSPMVWVIDGDSDALKAALERRVRAAGHLVYGGQYPLRDLPRLAVPTVYITITGQPETARVSRDDLPDGTLRVLATGSTLLPGAVSDEWDLCCALGDTGELPRLAKDFQGWLGAPDQDVLFRAIDARAKSDTLTRIEAAVESDEQPSLDASVVICTRCVSDRLVRAVRSVVQQNPAPGTYEILVVDNDAQGQELREAVARLCAEHFPDHPERLRLIVCPVSGLSAARNAGLAEARGEIVCFLDDDAVASPTWLSRILEAFASRPHTGVVGGHISLAIPEPRPEALQSGWEKYWSAYVTEKPGYTEVSDWRQFPWGANWSARREALRRIGGFRSGYGRTGNNFWGGEELVAACLIQRLGYAVAIMPGAEVVHDVDPSRFTLEHVRRTMSAGYQVGYRAERDLYLPVGEGARPALGQLVTHWFDRTVRPSWRARWLDAWFRKQAQVRLLATELNDLRRRAGRPVVADRS